MPSNHCADCKRMGRYTHDNAVAQLRAAILKSGLSATAYAKHILIRNPRTLRRWLRGDAPIPEAVREFLRDA